MDDATKELIAKAICYGYHRAVIDDPTGQFLTEELRRAYADRYVHTEWHEWKSEIPHFLHCADDSIPHPLG